LHNPRDDAQRAQVIEQYEAWLNQQLADPDSPQSRELEQLRRKYQSEGELTLICYCAPKPCHAQVIKRKLVQRVK